ncbi:MAG: Pyruvate phosphate dikinase [Chitinophagaceae bacterium]|nr:Pyruvate phosphate dikinase [Chitinophagaceae bacterium]
MNGTVWPINTNKHFIYSVTMKKIFSILILFFSLTCNAQEIITDLNGFRLGQYRETATNEWGKAFRQEKFEDGFEYEAFLIRPDSSAYMIFEYAAYETSLIWSIQISGNNTSIDLGFKNLKFGDEAKQVEKILGKPDNRENIGDYGEKWTYTKTNYSVEISTSGKLSSIKIINTYLEDKPDISKLPHFATIVKALQSTKNSDVALVLAPGLEIYAKDQTFFFSKSIRTEIATDYSKVFQTLRTISKGLNKINTSDLNSYEENIRLAEGRNPLHVIKIKSGHPIKEIVFDYINGQYLIWEIQTQ